MLHPSPLESFPDPVDLIESKVFFEAIELPVFIVLSFSRPLSRMDLTYSL